VGATQNPPAFGVGTCSTWAAVKLRRFWWFGAIRRLTIYWTVTWLVSGQLYYGDGLSFPSQAIEVITPAGSSGNLIDLPHEHRHNRFLVETPRPEIGTVLVQGLRAPGIESRRPLVGRPTHQQ